MAPTRPLSHTFKSMTFCRTRFASVTLTALFACTAVAVEPASVSISRDRATRINQFVQQRWDAESIVPAARSSDRIFVRRVYLDLAGRVPTVQEVDTFLASSGDSRREALIDELLESEDFVQHFTDLFDTLLMGRAPESKYAERISSGWRSYLEDVFRSNRPWNEVASEILRARPDEKDKRGAVWFLYERDDQHQAIAEAVAPAFFGIRIECAQCHDHMNADEIKQAHYWGLVAFFNRGKNTRTENGPQVAESAVGGFSDFANLEGDSSPNVLTFVDAEIVDESRPAAGQTQTDADDLYVEPSENDAPRTPKFSRRDRFVEEVLRDHPLLARAMVNRLWATLFGRGIVHPFDEMDSVHKPSHPEMLDWLADEFVESGYDVRDMVRSFAMSDAYQLQSRRPDSVNDPATFAWYLERPLTGEQLARSIQLIARDRFQADSELTKQFRQQISDVLPDETIVGVDDTLFLSNGSGLNEYLMRSLDDGGLLRRIRMLESHEIQVRELFQAVYAREPTSDETAAVVAYLEKRSDTMDAALCQVLWSLLTSAEFQFNH